MPPLYSEYPKWTSGPSGTRGTRRAGRVFAYTRRNPPVRTTGLYPDKPAPRRRVPKNRPPRPAPRRRAPKNRPKVRPPRPAPRRHGPKNRPKIRPLSRDAKRSLLYVVVVRHDPRVDQRFEDMDQKIDRKFRKIRPRRPTLRR